MSLDVWLTEANPTVKKGTGVFVRENGQKKELTPEEVREKFGEDIIIQEDEVETNEVWEYNITHNLGEMARQVEGLYEALWRPEENGYKVASDITDILLEGLRTLKRDPEKFKQFNPDNGWGNYEGLVKFVQEYLKATVTYPDALIEVWR